MRKFIQDHRTLSKSNKIPYDSAVVPRMPFTRLRFEEFGRIEVIKKFLIADLWFHDKEVISQFELDAFNIVGL